jgi:hypothetical protein
MRRHDPLIVGVLFTWGGKGWQGSFVVGGGHGVGGGGFGRASGVGRQMREKFPDVGERVLVE